jgi:hypothetical protein
LGDFGSVTFSGASASAGGRAGSITSGLGPVSALTLKANPGFGRLYATAAQADPTVANSAVVAATPAVPAAIIRQPVAHRMVGPAGGQVATGKSPRRVTSAHQGGREARTKSGPALALRTFLNRNTIAYHWVDVDQPDQDADVLRSVGATREDLPVVITPTRVLMNADPAALAAALGARHDRGQARLAGRIDVAIPG